MRRLRLAMLSRRFWPGMGSAETVLAQLASGLADSDCQVAVVAAQQHPHWPAKIEFHGFPVYRVGPLAHNLWRRRQLRVAVDRWLKQHIDELDLVYVLGMQDDAAAAIRAVDGRRPVVLAPLRSGRHGDCCWQVARFSRRSIKTTCLRADAFLAYSPSVRSELEAAGYPRKKIHDVCLGMGVGSAATGSTAPSQPRTAETQSLARSDLSEANSMLFLAANTKLVVCTTRPRADSDWQTLLAAWPMVLSVCHGARLWFVGEPACRGALLGRIRALGLEGRVQFVGAMDSVEAVVAAADLLVAPSPHGSHTAILEALAAGLPTVAVDMAINRWLLAEGPAGMLVPAGEPAALADAMARILTSPELGRDLAQAAWRRAARDFSLAKMLGDHLTLFRTLLAPQAGLSH